ncbi:MAG: ribonuclease HII [Sulfolobales archaeon]|nr:ribonuclease HII [Sulfolobales archaeon]MCX8186296.1 ribonuclease HII [Sulfolobales archaeon]MDW7968968.1 ribonuclease HII [Sulfolobales archaeon]
MGSTLLVIGIDEAGRGPLIGDMFVAAVGLHSNDLKVLEDAGVDDSKRLSPSLRFKLFNIIIGYSRYIFIKRFTPDVIDSNNINSLFIDALISAIKTAYALGFKPSIIYVDSTSNREKIINCLQNVVCDGTTLVVEYKADQKYIAVAAASIIAKVLRDSYISHLRGIYGDFGSGYPSDPTTIEWVEDYFRSSKALPPIVRKSWRTVKRFRGSQKSLEDYR